MELRQFTPTTGGIRPQGFARRLITRIPFLVILFCGIGSAQFCFAQGETRVKEPIQPAHHQAEQPGRQNWNVNPSPLNQAGKGQQRVGEENPDAKPLPPRNASVKAADSTSGNATRRATGTTSLWSTVLGLGGVLMLLAGATWWVQTHGPTKWRPLPNEAVEWLGRKVLEPKVSIHLVRCGSRMLILGVSPDGVRTLSEITDPVEIDLLAGACQRPETHRDLKGSFQSLFARTRRPVSTASHRHGPATLGAFETSHPQGHSPEDRHV